MKRLVIMAVLSFMPVWLLPGCAGGSAGSDRDAVLHSTVGGLRQAETRAETESGFWASAGEVGYGLMELPVNLVVDLFSLPADLWRAGKNDMEENRHRQELKRESDPWYEAARRAGKEE